MIPNDMNKAEKSSGKQLRRIVPIVVLCSGIGVALVAGARAPKDGVAQPAIVAHARSVELSQSPQKPLTAEYQKSQYSDVMVRSVTVKPKSASSKTNSSQNTRYVVPPGTKRQAAASSSYGTTSREVPIVVTLPNGQGVSRLIPASRNVYERASMPKSRAVGSPSKKPHSH